MAKKKKSGIKFGPASVNPITGDVTGPAGIPLPNISTGDINPNAARIPSTTVQIGDTKGAQTGSQVGGAVGGVVGSAFFGPVGGIGGRVVGSTVGSIAGGGLKAKEATHEHRRRNDYRLSLENAGLWEKGGSLSLPDGTTAQFNLDSQEGTHSWKNPGKRVDKNGDRDLFAYETDYTNDLDYLASMPGITLSRILSGKKAKEVDQVGSGIGNQLLGKAGYGADLNPQNFNTVMNNARAAYGRVGIHSKEDLIALANTMHAQGRIEDFDHAQMQQTASLVFDNDFNTAQKLMSGRWDGIRTAGDVPAEGQPQNKPGRIYSPVLSPEEALLSVQPYFDYYRAKFPTPKKSSGVKLASNITSGLGIFSALNHLSGGALTSGVKDIFSSIFNVGGADNVAGDIIGSGGDIISDGASISDAGDIISSAGGI